jgi:hypothetical protein
VNLDGCTPLDKSIMFIAVQYGHDLFLLLGPPGLEPGAYRL